MAIHETSNQHAKHHLNGDFARRRKLTTGFYWDDTLPGFGLRVGAKSRRWIVQFRSRGFTRRVTIGDVKAISAKVARREARAILADHALDGLPVKPDNENAGATTFAQFVPIFWAHQLGHWKPSTVRSARGVIKRHLEPAFGETPLSQIVRSDVMAWRDSMARTPGAFNRAIPILAVMIRWAEKLDYRIKGNSPCRGMPRYKTKPRERFLSAREFQRLGKVLRDWKPERARHVSAIRLLIYTGARKAEIEGLRWEWIGPDFVDLPDSKTGPKRIYLNRQANAVLDGLTREAAGPVFEGVAQNPTGEWRKIRVAAELDDVRLHDLRHSFASVAIMQGISLTKIGGLLGHALPETTFRYAHLDDSSVQDAATRVSGSIAKALGVAK